MPSDPLRAIRLQVEGGQYSLTPDYHRAVLKRIDDMITGVDSADQAIEHLGRPDAPAAARYTANLFYISGHGWRRFLADSAESVRVGIAIGLALRSSLTSALEQLAAMIDVTRTTISRQGNGVTLTCAVCDGDAVTFSVSRTGPEAPEQMVVSSLSPVTVFRTIAGPPMTDLLALMDGGDAAEVVKYLTVTQPAGCDACCPTCGGVYCKTHTAIEAQWTGSWHEATYATCPLGHEREIE